MYVLYFIDGETSSRNEYINAFININTCNGRMGSCLLAHFDTFHVTCFPRHVTSD